jgi:hypothetical protein
MKKLYSIILAAFVGFTSTQVIQAGSKTLMITNVTDKEFTIKLRSGHHTNNGWKHKKAEIKIASKSSGSFTYKGKLMDFYINGSSQDRKEEVQKLMEPKAKMISVLIAQSADGKFIITKNSAPANVTSAGVVVADMPTPDESNASQEDED